MDKKLTRKLVNLGRCWVGEGKINRYREPYSTLSRDRGTWRLQREWERQQAAQAQNALEMKQICSGASGVLVNITWWCMNLLGRLHRRHLQRSAVDLATRQASERSIRPHTAIERRVLGLEEVSCPGRIRYAQSNSRAGTPG